jgi:hypothetical protein
MPEAPAAIDSTNPLMRACWSSEVGSWMPVMAA